MATTAIVFRDASYYKIGLRASPGEYRKHPTAGDIGGSVNKAFCDTSVHERVDSSTKVASLYTLYPTTAIYRDAAEVEVRRGPEFVGAASAESAVEWWCRPRPAYLTVHFASTGVRPIPAAT